VDKADQLARDLIAAKTEQELRQLLPQVASVAGGAESDGPLDGLLSVLMESDERVALAIALWLSNPQQRPAAKALIGHCSVRYLMADAPPHVDLSLVTAAEASSAARRMNLVYAAPAFVAGWVVEMSKRWPEERAVFDSCNDVLFYLMREFPSPTHKLLSNLQAGDFTPKVWEVLSHYRSELAQDEARLDSFPWLNEFALSGREAELLRVYRQRTNDEIIQHAESRSIFAQFATRYRFKYARRVVLPAEGGETSLQMQEMTGHTPIPMSEWSDPIEGVRLRRELARDDPA